MTRRSGWADRARLINSSSTDVTDEIGIIIGADHDINTGDNTSQNAVNEGSKPARISQGINQYNAGLTVQTDNFYLLRMLGEVSGTDLVNVDELPEWTIQQQADENNYLEIQNYKAAQATVTIESGGIVEIEIEGQGLTTLGDENDPLTTGTLTKLSYANEPDEWDNVDVRIDDTTIGELQTFTFQINRGLTRRADVSSDSKDPQYLAPGPLELNLSELIVDVNDSTPWQTVTNRASHKLELELSNGEILEITGFKFTSVDPDEQDGEQDFFTATRSGLGTSWQVLNIGGT